MGLYSQLGPAALDRLEDVLLAGFWAQAVAERNVCSVFKLFPVHAATFSRAGAGVRSDFYECATRDEVVDAGHKLTRQFLNDVRCAVAETVKDPSYRQKVSGAPLLAQVTCPAKRWGVPLLSAPVAVAVDASGEAGAFEMQTAYGWGKFIFTREQPVTGDVLVYLAYDFRVRTVV